MTSQPRLVPIIMLLFVAGALGQSTPNWLREEADRVKAWNRQFDAAAETEAPILRSVVEGTNVRDLLKSRAASLSRLMEATPNAVVPLALSPIVRRRLLVANPDAAQYIESVGEWEGLLRVTVEDDFVKRESRTFGRLQMEGEALEVFGDGLTEYCGQQVKASGLRLASRIAISSLRSAGSPQASGCSTLGEQKVAVLLVRFPSTPLPPQATPAFVSNAFFGVGMRSLDDFWRENSYGLASASGSVFGPFTLDADYACDDFNSIQAAAIAAADPTVNFQNYTRIFIIMPGCGGGEGYSEIGCGLLTTADGDSAASISFLRFAPSWDANFLFLIAAHEAGHSLGLQHSQSFDFGTEPLGPPNVFGTVVAYGDPFAVMGGNNVGHYAAPHKSRLGWFASNNFVDLQANGTWVLQPYETPTTGTVTLRVKRSSGVNQWLWLEYRQPVGRYDTSLPSQAFSGAQGRLYLTTTLETLLLDFTPVAVPNNFIDAAVVNRTWTDPYGSLSVTVAPPSPSGLSVTVSYNSCVTLSSLGRSHGYGADAGSFNITAGGGCSWTALPSASWITLTSPTSGSGNGTINYTLGANAQPFARTGYITVAGQSFIIYQGPAPCNYSLAPTSVSSVPIAGATGFFGVTVLFGCPWSAVSNAPWISITYPPSKDGIGDGEIDYLVAPNSTSPLRVGTISVADKTFTVTQLGVAGSRIGAFNPSQGAWLLDSNGNHAWDGPPTDFFKVWGAPNNIPVMGDWNGTGTKKIGVFNPSNGIWLLDYNGNGVWDGPGVDKQVAWGSPGDIPVVGNWNGSGMADKIGTFNPNQGTWVLDFNGNFSWDGAAADKLVAWGSPGDKPVVGDWNGSGTAKIGIFNPTQGWWLLDYNGNYVWEGAATDRFLRWGSPGDTPVVGDWNGTGATKIGVFNSSQAVWLLDYNGNFTWDGAGTDKFLSWGSPGDTPVVGDWDGSGTTKIAVFNGSQGWWVIDYNGNYVWEGAAVDRFLRWGSPGDKPLVGKW